MDVFLCSAEKSLIALIAADSPSDGLILRCCRSLNLANGFTIKRPKRGLRRVVRITAQCYILGRWLPKIAAFDAVFDPRCTA